MPDRKNAFLRPLSHRFALESRQLFDGAALVEAVHHADPSGADPAVATAATSAHDAPAPTVAPLVSSGPADDAARGERPAAPAANDLRTRPEPAFASPSHEVYVVDQNIAGWQQLAAAVPAGSELILLDARSPGVQQLADALQGRSGITALHILSHGTAGGITLGSDRVDTASLGAQGEAWHAIGASLGEQGDILLYGCDVAADGARFADALSSLTGADVASSVGATGAASRQGDWVLESSVGAIEARSFSDRDYDGLLAAPTVRTTATRLTVAEPSSLNAAGADRATLNGFTLTDDGSGAVVVDVVVEDPSRGSLSSAQTLNVSTIAGGLRFTGSVGAANAFVNQVVFTAADVELGVTAAGTRIRVTVTDSEAPPLSATTALDVVVTPSNDPTNVADASQNVNEVGSTVLTVATLNAIDPEVTLGTQVPSQIVYALATDTTRGFLTLAGNRLGLGAVFTQQDVIDGRVAYTHTATGASQNLADGFSIRVNDGATPSARSDGATIRLDVVPLNQPPTVAGNGIAFEGQPANARDAGGNPAAIVGNFIVAEGGGDDGDAALSVRLTSLPTDGTLVYSGLVSIGGVSQTVTDRIVAQSDVDAGFVFAYTARGGLRYANTGDRDSDADPATDYPFADGFGVTVTDGGGGAGPAAARSTSSIITINVRPVDDDPVLVATSSLEATVSAAGTALGPYTVTITPAMLDVRDVDSADERLTIAVTSTAGLDQGLLLLNGSRLPTGATFTIADVKAGRVQYVQTAGAGASDIDTFRFQVLDNTTGPRWNADGSRIERQGGVYADNGTPTAYGDDTLRTFDFTLRLVPTPAGNGGNFTPAGTATTLADSAFAGTNEAGSARGSLLEGGSVVLSGTGSDFSTTPGLSYTADGVPPSQVVYTVLGFDGVSGGGWNGQLQRLAAGNWVALDLYDTFTQADLDAHAIRFVHDGVTEDFQSSVRLTASAGVLVADANGVLRPDAWNTRFTFYATPVNDAPVATGSSNAVIPEGGIAPITTGLLAIGDPDDATSEAYLEGVATLPDGSPNYAFDNAATGPGALRFEVLGLPAGGSLQFSTDGGASWNAVAVNQVFDASILTASAATTGLRFVSDGGETRATGFAVRAIDRWGATSGPASVGIQITNVNDTPQIASDPTQPDPGSSLNEPLTVAEGGFAQIPASLLTAFDPDSTTTQVQYTITGAAAHGRVAYSTNGTTFLALGVGSSFSQDDVNAGRIYYLHGGDESDGAAYPSNPPDDFFTFRIGDGDKEQAGNRFWIYVTPSNDAPVVTAPAGPVFVDGSGAAFNPIPGFGVADIDLDATTSGETDAIQVTVRLLDASGTPFTAASYAGVTLGSTSLGGVVVDGDKNGAGDFLTLRGTRAQVNAALAGLSIDFSTDRDAIYQVQVIVDDRLRDAGGVLSGGANGGPANQAVPTGAPGVPVPATEYDWYAAAVPTSGAIAGNIAAASTRVFASSVNDPGVLDAPSALNVNEDQPSFIGGAFVVSDAESAAFDTPVTVRLSVPEGVLGIGGAGVQTTATPTSGRAVAIAGDNTGTLTLTGRAADIQALINSGSVTGLTYRSAGNVNDDRNGAAAGDVTLTVSFDDAGSRIGGDTGAGSVAANPADRIVALTIVPVNDAPAVTLAGGVTPATPVVLTGGAVPTAVPGFVLGDIDIDGDIAGNGAASDVVDGEVDFLQVTVRITDAAGVALPATDYAGPGGDITIGSSNGASGAATDGSLDGTGSALRISGTRQQVQDYLAGLSVALSGALANGDRSFRVEVIVDDRVRDGGGNVLGANGGQNDNAGNGVVAPGGTAIDPYAALPGGLAANVASTYRTLFPSAINDPAQIAGSDFTVVESGATVGLTGITITDQDALGTSVLTATVSVPAGFGIASVGGAGGTAVISGDTRSVTLTGTLAQINGRINAIVVALPDAPGTATAADWNGRFNVTVVVDDEGNTGGRPATLAAGNNATTGTFAYQDGTAADLVTTRVFSFTVNPANDAPVIVNGTTETLAAVNEDTGSGAAGQSVAALFGNHFGDAADQIDNAGIDATGGSSADTFFGVAIRGLTVNSAQGEWQYALDGSTWTAVGARSDANALVLASSALLRFVPAADFHGTPNPLSVRLVETDANNDSATTDPTSGSTVNLAATGGTTVYSDGVVSLSTSVVNVNDRPTASNGVLATGAEDQQGLPAPTATVTGLFGAGYSDAIDNRSGIAGGGNAATPLGGLAIVGNASTAAQGAWQYSIDGGNSWTGVPATPSDAAAVLLPATAQLRFVPAANFNGAPGSLTVRVADSVIAVGSGDISAAVADATGTWSLARTLSTSVGPRNDAPVLSGTAANIVATENGQTGTGTSIPPTRLLTGASVADLDLANTAGLNAAIFGAGRITVSFDGYRPGDRILVDAVLPPGVVASGGIAAPLVVQFDADTTLADVQGVLNALAYASSSDNPTAYGTDTDRVFTVVVNDGNNLQAGGNAGGPAALDSNLLTGTLSLAATNDAPSANDDTHAIAEDAVSVAANVISGRVPGQGDVDPDHTTLVVTALRTGAEAGIGIAGSVGSPLSGNYGSLVMASDGSYVYTLNNADPRVQALVAGQTLTEQYTYTVSDGAGGVDVAQLTITIAGATDGGAGDDLPGLVLVDANGAAAGHIEVDEAGLTSLADTRETASGSFDVRAADGLLSVTLNGSAFTLAQLQGATPASPLSVTTAAGVLRITGFAPTATTDNPAGTQVTAGTVSYAYTLVQPQAHGAAEVTDPFAIAVADRDGDTANGTLDVRIVDDAPSAAADAARIGEDAVPNTTSGNVRTNDRLGADNGNGVPVTAVAFNGTPGVVGSPLATAYGSIVLAADGSYTYTLDNGNAAVNALRDNDTLTESVTYTLVDADGDTSTAVLTITIDGRTDAAGGPSIVAVDGNGASSGQADVVERGLVDGPAGPDARESTAGTIAIAAADGLASVEIGGSVLTLADLQGLAGVPRIIDTGEGTLTLTGFTATALVGGVPISGTLAYDYVLKAPQQQPGTAESLDLVALGVTDAGGGVAAGTLQVRIVDDLPQAVGDTAAIVEDASPATLAGNLRANDLPGADAANGVPVTAIGAGGVAGTIGLPLATRYGSIVVQADGSYVYALDNAHPQVQRLLPGETLVDVVSYAITDADGDTSNAELVITIGGSNDGATLDIVDGDGPGVPGQATVAERGLGDTADASETTSGRFVIRTPDGLGSIEVGGTTLTPAQLAGLAGSPVTVATPRGQITLTGFDPATGVVEYRYTLVSRQPHPASGDLTDDIAIVVRDRDGDLARGSLQVRIVDDAPAAVDDAASLGTALPGATVAGNVVGGAGSGPADRPDRIGADATPQPVVAFAFDGRPGVVGGAALAGAFGSLRMEADGRYVYAVDDRNARVASLGDGQTLTDTFSYTVTDADGSRSTAQLVVTIRGASQFRPLEGDRIFPSGIDTGARTIAQGMEPAVFVQLSVRESQRVSQALVSSIVARLGGGVAYQAVEDADLFDDGQDAPNVQHVLRDGVGFSLRLLRDMQQTLEQRGLSNGEFDGITPLVGDFEGSTAPEPSPASGVALRPATPDAVDRIVVGGTPASIAPGAVPADEAAGQRADGPVDAPRSLSARLAASAAERGTVRESVRLRPAETIRLQGARTPA